MKFINLLAIFLLTSLGISSGIYGQNIVAAYPFNGSAQDASGNGNDAMIRGAILTQDRFGVARQAFSFDGKSALVAPNSDLLQSDYTTISFWVKVNSLPEQGEVFLLSHGGWQERWKISLPAHGKPVFTTNSSDGISDMDSGDGNELTLGDWHQVVMTHDGTNDVIYLDGAMANTKAVTGTLNATQYPLGMGFDPIGGSLYFDGSLDEVMLFDAAMTAEQVADLYAQQSTAPTFEPGMVANYPFDGNALDATSYANHGQMNATTPTTNRFGFGSKALAFNGTSSTVTASNSSALNGGTTTVTFWVKPNTLPEQGEAYLMSFGGWQERWKISLPSHGKAVWTTNETSGISDMDAGDGHELVPGVWTQLAFVHNGSQDQIYVNGALANSKDVTGDLNPTTYDLGIGYNPIDGGNYFDGAIDDIQIYNFALSDTAIQELYTTMSANPATDADLVAQYNFTGNTSDGSQYVNDLTNDGASFTADRFNYGGHAYDFDGVGSSMTAANSPALNSATATISFWVNVTELPAQGEAYLLSNGGWQERWKISLPSHGKPVFTTNYENGISDMDSGDGNELVPGTWMHVAMVHDGAKDLIYMNGNLANEKDVVGSLNATKYPFGVGYNPIDGGNYFNGALDDILLFNRALTAEEIAALYGMQSIEPTYSDTLVADYGFNGSGKDASVYANPATISGVQFGKDRFNRSNHALVFDGASSEATAANSPQLNSDLATVSFWINAKALPEQGEAFLLSFGGWQERWKISLPAHGKPVWTTNNESGISDMDSGDGNALVPGSWYQVVMVHDGAKDKIFINGAKANEKDVTGNLNTTTYPLGIGYNPIDGGSYFNGSLDDIQIYSIALTDEEVAALYAAQSAAPEVTDSIAPSAPLDLVAGVQNTTVLLTWSPSTDNVGVTGYNVFRDSVKMGTVSSPGMTLTDLPQLTTFTFGVTAVDEAGNESVMSTVIATTGQEAAPDTIAPSAPGNLSGNPGAHSVLLSWEASTDNRAVAGYVVYVDGTLVDTVGAGKTSILVSDLDAETPYFFEVYAFDLAGNISEVADITISTIAEFDTGEDGLVAYYPFEGNADDATPYANHGVIGGDPTFQTVTDRLRAGGQAIVFDGDQDSVLAANAVQLLSDYATVSFWIRVDGQNVSDAEAYVLDFGHWDQRWKISLPQHLRIVWTTNSKNSQFDNAISDMDSKDGNELIVGYWWFVTMVHDGTDDIIYIDGQEVNRKPAAGTLNSTDRPFCMGSNPIEGGQYFQGALDEVKIYNKALTGEEIASLYANGTTSVPSYNAVLNKYIELVYPNPTTSSLQIRHHFTTNQSLLVRVFNAQGMEVSSSRTQTGYGNNDLTIDASKLPQGSYYVNFVLGGKNLGSLRFVKQ